MKIVSAKQDFHIFYPAFMRNIIILSLVLFLPASVMTKISVNVASDNLLAHVMDKETELLESYKRDIESKLNIIDNISNQILFDNDVWNYLYLNINEPNYFIIKNILQKLENHIYSNDMIESIYFFDKKHGYIISDGITSKKAFSDQLVFDNKFLEGTTLKMPRILDRSTIFTKYQPVNITGYVKKLNNISTDNEVILVINLKTEQFYNLLTAYNNDNTIFITDLNYKPIYCSKENSNGISCKLSEELIQQINLMEQKSKILHIENDSYFVTVTLSPKYDLRFIKIQNYNAILNSVNQITNRLITYLSLVLAISIIFILLSAYYLYYPLSTILHKIRRYNLTVIAFAKNEYVLIDKTIENLYHQNVALNQKFEIAYNYLETYSLHEFLINPKFDQTEFEKLLKVMNISFSYPSFMIALINVDRYPVKNIKDLKNAISPLLSSNNGIECLISLTREDSIAVVINTCNRREEILKYFEEILKNFQNQGINATIGLGETFDNISLLPIYYNDTFVKANQKFFSRRFEVLDLSSDYRKNITNYHNELQEKLINAIKLQDREKAFETLELLFSECLNNASDSVDYIKYVIYQVASNVIKNILALGANYYDEEISEYQLYRIIKNSDHMTDIKIALRGFIEKSIASLEELSQRRYSELIQQTVEYIGQNFKKDISLVDIAKYVHLSPNYLSNIFKRERGKTIFDTITDLRMKQAAELLKTTDLHVNKIANKIGYNNVQSFIRFFKKYFGLTPNEYRKNIQ